MAQYIFQVKFIRDGKMSKYYIDAKDAEEAREILLQQFDEWKNKEKVVICC